MQRKDDMNTNQDIVKAAATRMCQLLGAKGVPVKHGLMLEALATGFGLDNWRTLKAVIDAPRAASQPAPKTLPPLGVSQVWLVDAIYFENNQPYGDDYFGRTALEAAYAAMVERLTDFNLDIGIYEVSRAADDPDSLMPSSTEEFELKPSWNVLKDLLNAVPSADNLTPELATAYRWLAKVVQSYAPDKSLKGDPGPLHDLLDYEANGVPQKPGTIGEPSTLTPTKALLLLCDCVEARFETVMQMEDIDEELACTCYQVRAMCEFFESALNGEDVSMLVDIDFE